MRVKILGKYYNLKFVPNLGSCDGSCDHPEEPRKTIRIQSGLDEKVLCETIIHEILHGADWHKSEEWVEELALDITNTLYKLGYKRSNQ